MDMTKMLPQVAIWPSLATTAGMGFTLIARGIYLVCHPCHCFEESILNSECKKIFKTLWQGRQAARSWGAWKNRFFDPVRPPYQGVG
jgi:hypothetical protein